MVSRPITSGHSNSKTKKDAWENIGVQINAVFLKCYILGRLPATTILDLMKTKYRNYHIIVNGYTGYNGNYTGLMEIVKVPVGLYW